MNIQSLISARAEAVQESVIRRVFEGARDVVNPINLSIGQPDFPVPEPVKQAAIRAIQADHNGYSNNRGIDPLLKKIAEHLRADLGWDAATTAAARPGQAGLMVTQGTSGGLIDAAMALLDPGDEIIIPDPYFVLYPRLGELTGARAVPCDTYPDFRLTAARVEPLITKRTKAVLLCTPSNPCGVVASEQECADLLDLCRRRNVLLISDEIYDEFTYAESRTGKRVVGGGAVCPSPARLPGAHEDVLLVRGFGKTYGFTGWRMGYVAGPSLLVDKMVKMQQHLYICAPTPLQYGAVEAYNVDMSGLIEKFRKRRDMVVEKLSAVTEVPFPGGAFYAFVRVPARLGLTADQFMQRARAQRVLVVPGYAFSARDTHFRISYAVKDEILAEGLEALVELMKA
jgi:aspartate/methionine/tyrosine aminotransferase